MYQYGVTIELCLGNIGFIWVHVNNFGGSKVVKYDFLRYSYIEPASYQIRTNNFLTEHHSMYFANISELQIYSSIILLGARILEANKVKVSLNCIETFQNLNIFQDAKTFYTKFMEPKGS